MIGAENGNTLEGNFVLYIGNQQYTYENDSNGWNSEAPLANFVNQWHRESHRNNTPGGAWSMKFGGPGAAEYSGAAYGALESPDIPLGENGRLYFHHWMDAETHSNPIYAWDGGLVEISVDGGPWLQITPVGGYPYSIYNNAASPFTANTNVYSGSFDWTQAEFDISSFSGLARFRFVFGSDGYVGGEGWYIDDVFVESDFSSADDLVQTLSLSSLATIPTPSIPPPPSASNFPRPRLSVWTFSTSAGRKSAAWWIQSSPREPTALSGTAGTTGAIQFPAEFTSIASTMASVTSPAR